MSYVEPNNTGDQEKTLCFDFPLELCAPESRPNLDAEDSQLDIVQWSLETHGFPARYQGSPLLVEAITEPEDENIDLIMDQATVSQLATDPLADTFYLYHTARLTGNFLPYLLLGATTCGIEIDLVPTLGSPTPPRVTLELPLTDAPCTAENMWGWYNSDKTEYICTIKQPFSANSLAAEEIYRVIVRWIFYRTDTSGSGVKTRERWGGFEDALHFSVRGAV